MTEATFTGLLPSIKISLKKPRKKVIPKLDFQSCIRPVVYEVKPLGTYFNPFGSGCSILCNHPVETDFRASLSPARLQTRKVKKRDERKVVKKGEKLVEKMGRQVGGMLERMNVAPHLQDPTRKCYTPSASRPTLILDLRRSHSSDNLPSATAGGGGGEGKQSAASLVSAATVSSAQTISRTPLPATKEETEEVGDGTRDDEVPRRRGRKIKKKKKSFQDKTPRQPSMGIIEPKETQVSTYSESVNILEEGIGEKEPEKGSKSSHQQYLPPHCSIFDLATLRHLRRNMANMDAQAEYSQVWRRVLKEALSASSQKSDDKENEDSLCIPSTNPDQWINLPRLFSLSSARFQLPLDRNTLNSMEPHEYLRDHVFVAKGKKMLYNHVFLKYSTPPEDGGHPTQIPTKCIWEALGEVVGGGLDQNKRQQLWQYLDWDEDLGSLDLLTWYGVCAFTERIIGKERGGRSLVEEADFELLPRILTTVRPSEKLIDLLKAIHSIGESSSVTASPYLWKNLLQLQISHTSIDLDPSRLFIH